MCLTCIADTVDAPDIGRAYILNWFGARWVIGCHRVVGGIPQNEEYKIGWYTSISGNEIQACFDIKSKQSSIDSLGNKIYLAELYISYRSKKTSKLRVTGLCEENSPVTVEFPTLKASNAKNASIWWHHHVEQRSNIEASEGSHVASSCVSIM